MHKAKLGQKYADVMTGSYLPFIIFVTIFVSLIVWMAASISLDVMTTYSGSFFTQANKTFIRVEAQIDPAIKEVYAYKDRNSNVYKMKAVHVTYDGKKSYIELDKNEGLSDLKEEFTGDDSILQFEVSKEKVTLLKRILPLGDSKR
ncbi:hypothetical protein H6F38_20390 [Paenibacillus sp. EKM208P]|nr:hypothetical protein H6F38_20390 [Paenibacillus sp. EKM208P]